MSCACAGGLPFFFVLFEKLFIVAVKHGDASGYIVFVEVTSLAPAQRKSGNKEILAFSESLQYLVNFGHGVRPPIKVKARGCQQIPNLHWGEFPASICHKNLEDSFCHSVVQGTRKGWNASRIAKGVRVLTPFIKQTRGYLVGWSEAHKRRFQRLDFLVKFIALPKQNVQFGLNRKERIDSAAKALGVGVCTHTLKGIVRYSNLGYNTKN
jgi:hypothetical protein